MPRATAVPTPLLTASLIGGLVLGGGLLGACGATNPAATTSTTTAPTSTSGAGSVTGTAAAGAASAGAAPAVTNATNLGTAPVIHAGTPPAPTQLIKKDLVVGTGVPASARSTVRVQYVGANYADGKVFDSSWSRGQPTSFPLNGVIPGFAQGIVGMKVGGRRELVIPPALGYGASGSGSAVGPNETLVFVIDLLAVQ